MCSTMKICDAQSVLSALEKAGQTLATAESCTGGWVGKMLTDIPGSSKCYKGGIISYTNEVKHSVLGVPKELLDNLGPVSEPVAIAMAEGARRITNADIAVSVTGLAGPDGDGSGRPVGLVYIALNSERETLCRQLQLSGDRFSVREQACYEIFALIMRALEAR